MIDAALFLHHAQLDRLWSILQQFTTKRMVDYGGPLYRDILLAEASAHIGDILRMEGLALDISVKDILNTRRGKLCYLYN